MLTITEPAAEFLTRARDESDIPNDASLRIGAASDGDAPGITLGFVDEPLKGDAVGESHGLPVCVAPEVSAALDSAVLDVVSDDEGAHLVLVPEA